MDRHYEDTSEPLKITKMTLGKSNVGFQLARALLWELSEDTSNEDLTGALKEAGFNGAVAERIFKSKEKIKTKVSMRDFNAHHPTWEPTKLANTASQNIAEMLLDDPSISLITPPSLPTYYNVYQNSFSTLDLTFVSANFQPTVAVTTEEVMGSDHYPVVTSIGVAPSTAGFRNGQHGNLEVGQENWTAALQQPELQGMDYLQRDFINFTNNLTEASQKVFKKQKKIPVQSIISLGETQNVLQQ
ncbi:Endonuclease/exonuclease/phosphatase [Trinorchestia longiramus]|nr:Endonuclease/exonuclease/phosphatase [Trinorchestia longiramus]